MCSHDKPVNCLVFFSHTCDLTESSWLSVRSSSNCCLSSTKASCFSQMSFSSIFMDNSISCFIPICTSSSFSTSYTHTQRLLRLLERTLTRFFEEPTSEMNVKMSNSHTGINVLLTSLSWVSSLSCLRVSPSTWPFAVPSALGAFRRNTGQISENRAKQSETKTVCYDCRLWTQYVLTKVCLWFTFK